MTPLQALRIIEREIEASGIQLSEGSELTEALNTLWSFALTGEREREKRKVADRVYCTNPGHGYGEHSISCTPPADPGNPELRLLRAIYGLCPDCNVTEEHEHPCRECGKEQPLPDGSYCYHEERK